MSTDDKKQDWLYYYALYHVLAHWTAYITILVLLIVIGFQLSTSVTPVTHAKTAVMAIVALWAGEIYLVHRIRHLGNFVHEQLGEAVRPLESLRHPGNHWLTFSAASLFALWDILLVTRFI